MTQQHTHSDPSHPVGPPWYGEPESARTAASPDAPTRASGTGSGGYGQAYGSTQASQQTVPTPTQPGYDPIYGHGTTGSSTPGSSAPGTDWYQGHGSHGGSGGFGGPTTPTPVSPAPAPKTRGNRGLGQLTAVAILAAALASGGTYAATRYAEPSPTATTTTTTQSGTTPEVIQGNSAAPDWTATAKAVAPAVVSITVQSRSAEGQGSGVVIDTSGHILTNNHVATGAGTTATITVTLNDGRTYDAKVVGTDPSTDLAVLSLVNPPSDLTAISFGDSSALTVGQPVMAIGNPLGLSGTVTTGIVSALDRPVTTSAATEGQQGQLGSQSTSDAVVTNAIQTSAAINPGNSGGALVTADGKLIGINSSIASLGSSSSSQSGNIGIGFAIPSNEAKSIADQLIANGTAQHAYIGVSASDTTVTDNGSKRSAALIQSVSSGTPAEKAGLQTQDAVIAIDGQVIDSSEAFVANIHEHKVGDRVTLTVIRGGQKQDIQVTLAARPG